MTKKRVKKGWKDPYAQREAEKYEKPIASRELILRYLEERGKPADFEDIAADLVLSSEEDLEALRRRLKAMCRDGQLNLNRRDGYGLINKMNLITGRVQGHQDGFGFVIPDDLSGDLVLNARQMRRVFDGDRVLVRIMGLDYRGRREGSIVEVLERNTHEVVGRYAVEEGVAIIIPENKRISQNILITPDKKHKAKPGQIVVVQITIQPNNHVQPAGYISEILGDAYAPGQEIDIALRAHQIPFRWPESVLKEVEKLKPTVEEKAKKGRVDLRDLPLVTIDGDDAQDFDDAVFAEKKGKNYRLIVAIADVSHYVGEGSALDQEAIRRGNSVYFPGKVIPMLPEILSNELCSLRPKVDRLCVVAEMIINPQGEIIKSQFFEAVMHSKARFTYKIVQAMLDGDQARQKEYADLWPMVQTLYKVYQLLLAEREKRGALDFASVETQIIFGLHKKIEKIVPTKRVESHRLIEECMLAANVAVAKFLSSQKNLPILYRAHNGPKPERLAGLRQFLSELGLSLPGTDKPTPLDYARLLESIQQRPDAHLIQTMLLRSLAQAVYSPENAGHFGLAYPVYAHFTSPIRRYPDLLIHRAVKYAILKEKYPYTEPQMIQLGEHCSLTERRADDATRDAVLSLKCQFLKDKVGQEFNGIVSHVASFGLFVELQDIYVEGLVHVTSLQNDYYIFDAAQQRLRGERTGKVFRLGDKLRVLVARVNVEEKKIDFELLSSLASAKSKSEKTKGKAQQKAKEKSQPKPKATKTASKEKPKRKRRVK
jgi:ribonuclease R